MTTWRQAVCKALGEAEYAMVPPFGILPRIEVRCEDCGKPLRPGDNVAVRIANGVVRCVKCPTDARVPRGKNGLEKALRASLEVR